MSNNVPPLPTPKTFQRLANNATDLKVAYAWFQGVANVVGNVSNTVSNANGSYVQAYTTANLAYNQANAAYSRANTACAASVVANGTAQLAYDTANSAYSTAIAANSYVYLAYNEANLAYTVANLAYATANLSQNDISNVYVSGALIGGYPNINFTSGNTANIIVSGTANSSGNITITIDSVIPGLNTTVNQINTDSFSATSGQYSYTLSSSIANAGYILVTRNGLIETPTKDYTVSGATLSFTTSTVAGERIEVREFISSLAGLTGIVSTYFSPSANQSVFTLPNSFSNNDFLLVSINGVLQAVNEYTVSGTTLTISSNAKSGSTVEVRQFTGNSSAQITGVDTFVSSNGQTAFAMNGTATSATYAIVSRNGVIGLPGVDYIISGTSLVLTTPCVGGDVVEVRRLLSIGSVQQAISSVGVFAQGNYINNTVNLNFVSANTSNLTVTGVSNSVPGNVTISFDTAAPVSNAYNQANAAFSQANLAYTKANVPYVNISSGNVSNIVISGNSTNVVIDTALVSTGGGSGSGNVSVYVGGSFVANNQNLNFVAANTSNLVISGVSNVSPGNVTVSFDTRVVGGGGGYGGGTTKFVTQNTVLGTQTFTQNTFLYYPIAIGANSGIISNVTITTNNPSVLYDLVIAGGNNSANLYYSGYGFTGNTTISDLLYYVADGITDGNTYIGIRNFGPAPNSTTFTLGELRAEVFASLSGYASGKVTQSNVALGVVNANANVFGAYTYFDVPNVAGRGLISSLVVTSNVNTSFDLIVCGSNLNAGNLYLSATGITGNSYNTGSVFYYENDSYYNNSLALDMYIGIRNTGNSNASFNLAYIRAEALGGSAPSTNTPGTGIASVNASGSLYTLPTMTATDNLVYTSINFVKRGLINGLTITPNTAGAVWDLQIMGSNASGTLFVQANGITGTYTSNTITYYENDAGTTSLYIGIRNYTAQNVSFNLTSLTGETFTGNVGIALANAAYLQANLAYSQANAAYTAANGNTRYQNSVSSAVTINFASDKLVGMNCTGGNVTVSLSNYTTGAIVDLIVYNSGAGTTNVIHGLAASHATNGNTYFASSKNTIYLRYFCLDGTSTNIYTFVNGNLNGST